MAERTEIFTENNNKTHYYQTIVHTSKLRYKQNVSKQNGFYLICSKSIMQSCPQLSFRWLFILSFFALSCRQKQLYRKIIYIEYTGRGVVISENRKCCVVSAMNSFCSSYWFDLFLCSLEEERNDARENDTQWIHWLKVLWRRFTREIGVEAGKIHSK